MTEEISYPEDWRDIPKHAWEYMGLTPEEYQAMRTDRLVREKCAPKPGELAPDFSLERLSDTGQRTGENVELSSLRGIPVALLFGSYT